MKHDVWFARYNRTLWVAYAKPGEAPIMFPQRVESVKAAIVWLREAGISIGQVGITDSDMLGLE